MQHRFQLATAAVLSAVILVAHGTAAAAYASTNAHAAERAWIAAAIRKAYAGSGAQVTIGSMRVLDTASPCPEKPLVAFAGNGPYRTARVQCAALGWQFYIPFTIAETSTVVVAAHDLSVGQPLTASDLRLVQSAGQSGSNLLAQNEQTLIGQTLTVPVARGEAIARAELQEPMVVRAGQNLTVRVESANIEVTTVAVALQNGRRGQTIWVKNPDTGKRYQVTANGDGSASYQIGYQ